MLPITPHEHTAPHHREALLDPERGFQGTRVEGLDFFVEHTSWKRLPKEVFEPLGGYEAAKLLRQERQEAAKKAAADIAATAAAAAATAAATAAAAEAPVDQAVGANESKGKDAAAASSSSSSVSAAGATTTVAPGASAGTGTGNAGSSSTKRAAASATKIEYSLGKRWFSDELYGSFGCAEVDTIEQAHKKLRMASAVAATAPTIKAEAGAPEAAFRAVKKEVVLLKDLPVILPQKRGALKNTTAPGKKPTNIPPALGIPNVTWSLLDSK
jgi:hypothetical protein